MIGEEQKLYVMGGAGFSFCLENMPLLGRGERSFL